MKNKTTQPTMKDVAAKAGVSLGTVSKVLNGIPVGEEYRIRVEEAAKEINYRINKYARGLKTNKTYTIALILPTTNHPFYALLADYIGKELFNRGYHMLVSTTEYSPIAEQKCIHMVQENKVDGIIGLTYCPTLEIDDSIPYVSIDRYVNPSVPCVASDNFSGGQLAAQKLVELGCKKILCLHTSSRIQGEPDKRNAGFSFYCQVNQIEHAIVQIYNDQSEDTFWDHISSHIHDGKLEYDGIFCGTDHLAYRTIQKLNTFGLKVPEDVQIIGFDGIRRFGSGDYYCSTIVQPLEEISKNAIDILLTEERNKKPALLCVPVSYQYGGTTKE